jgi:Ca2+-binding RTX toxin-like protein
VSFDGTTVTITGGPESNAVEIDEFDPAILVRDTAAGAIAEPPCYVLNLGSNSYAACDTTGPANVVASLGDGVDAFTHANPMSNEDRLGTVAVDAGAGDDGIDLFNVFIGHRATIDGGAGNDAMRGGLDADLMRGGPGDDTVDGSGGNDEVFGDEGNDTVAGGNDSDRVDGGAGADALLGDGGALSADGDDQIFARDGEGDEIGCGFGSDLVTADPFDVADGSCESVDVGPGGDDTQAPNTQKGKGPKKEISKRSASFAFSSPDDSATFECKLDKKPAKPCTSPARARRLKPGRHAFSVTAIDAAGNEDPTPAVWRFRVLE